MGKYLLYACLFILMTVFGCSKNESQKQDDKLNSGTIKKEKETIMSNTKNAKGTPTPLAFLVWDGVDLNKEPTYFDKGQTAQIKDGDLLTLFTTGNDYVTEKGLTFDKVTFTTVLEKDGAIAAEHSYKMINLMGNNIEIFSDPRRTNPNGSFTAAFMKVLVGLGEGQHEFTVKVFAEANGEIVILNEGKIICESKGSASLYQKLIPLFDDPNKAREEANAQFQKEQDEAFEKEEKESMKSNVFSVSIKNQDTGHTKYIITKDQRTLSEKIYEVQPGKTLVLELYKSNTYEILFYDQDAGKESARSIVQGISSDKDGSVFQIK
ncbi:MAG: hypothetical protein A2Y41_09815 [Spirochaetes bacterium GWB1_36_13]|nr:MAG: hypothetical protein A2Y41_09815 [Spirochaetes bacterium GWB1_36_13]